MSTNYVFVHQVIARRLPGSQGSGWEFVCGRCSYRAVSIKDPVSGLDTFHLADPGSPQTSHPHPGQPPPVNAFLMRIEYKNAQPARPAFASIPALPGTDWLPPHLVRQIEQILLRCGGDAL